MRTILKWFMALALILLVCLLIVFIIFPKTSEYKPIPYVINMAYSSNGNCCTIRLNETAQEVLRNYIDAIKDLGVKHVGVAELECYYLDGYLGDYLQLLQENGLNASIYFMWRDFTIPVDFSLERTEPFPEDFWKPSGFPDNTTKVETWLQWITNVTEITKNYPNVEFYLLFMPFRWAGDYQANFSNQTYYRLYMQQAVSTIKSIDPKPVILVSDGIEMENQSLIQYIPYDLVNIDGYGFTYYTRTQNQLDSNLVYMTNLYQDKIKQFLNSTGYLFLAEWGWQTTSPPVYGKCEGETQKSRLITETLNTIKDLRIEYFAYFCLQNYFPADNADFGLIYDNFTLKPSGYSFKEWISQNVHNDTIMFQYNCIFPLFSFNTSLRMKNKRKHKFLSLNANPNQ